MADILAAVQSGQVHLLTLVSIHQTATQSSLGRNVTIFLLTFFSRRAIIMNHKDGNEVGYHRVHAVFFSV